MLMGVQFTGNVPAGETRRWFTHSWDANHNVIWMVTPTGPAVDGGAQIEWKVQNTRQTDTLVKWFIEVRNLSDVPVDFEARYAIPNA